MFIMPSFKKSLIVEQFQGNYLNKLNEEHFTFHLQYKYPGTFANRKYEQLSYPKNPKMCDPILVTLLKMQPHYSQSSRENATPSSFTSLLASYKELSAPQNYYLFWIDHLVVKSSFKGRTEAFSFYIIGEMFRTNELLWIRLAFAYLFSVRDT